MYCLDTDILIEYLRGNNQIVEKLSSVYGHGVGLFTTFISLCELYRGVYASKNMDKQEADINALLYSVSPLEMDQHSCIFFGKEWNRLQTIGKQTQVIDLMIASIAAINNLTLVTGNIKHYQNIEGLKMEKWC